jgi:hypothetical protein
MGGAEAWAGSMSALTQLVSKPAEASLPLTEPPSLPHTLTKLASPPHSTWQHLWMHVITIADTLHPRILTCTPGALDTALRRIFINTYSIVMALWLAGCTNPSHSAGSDTCKLMLRMLQFGHVSQ